MASGGVGKVDIYKGTTNDPVHMMLVDSFEDSNIGAKYHFFLSQVVNKFSNLPVSWMLINSDRTIRFLSNKAMVWNIQKSPNLITLHCNVGLRQVEYTANING